jgi:hypothetical protein
MRPFISSIAALTNDGLRSAFPLIDIQFQKLYSHDILASVHFYMCYNSGQHANSRESRH